MWKIILEGKKFNASAGELYSLFMAKNVPLKVVSTINSLALLVENYVGTAVLLYCHPCYSYKIGWNLVIQNRQSENRIKPSAPLPNIPF